MPSPWAILHHGLDQVGAGDHLGDRVLDLQPGVHLQEVELAVGGQDELHRAGAPVVDGLGRLHRGGADRARAVRASARGRGIPR